ncbi:MAG: adenosylmethionine--8-amino-7-oxononanoate transaminase [Leptospiraceae bacterium]|nr:adenosylmethionine--8-amino-7-oxononanoate transaminase [Leptospiraceae bacterium]MDW7976578.1 adenosylmethionine--8-amino-7-oxononanoate transaminase [Leptospiraceae bacterium]
MEIQHLLELHRRHTWWPFTQMKLAKPPFFIEKGKGIYLYGYDSEGNPIEFIDAISSWWVSVYGHGHPSFQKVLQEQLSKLEHVIYASLEHPTALNLARTLSEKTQHQLPKVFYSDDGSTAMEIAIKMAFQYYQNQGKKEKTMFFVLENGYHGDTIGTMSVGARSEFHKVYEPLMFPVISLPMTYNSQDAMFDETLAIKELKDWFVMLEKQFKEHHSKVCGIVLEPLIQGAAGMLMYHPVVLKKIRELCDEFDVLMICDEVFTGAGRTGPFFAFEHSNIYPDIVALSKGLPAGYATFAATLSKEKVFMAFYSDDRSKTLFHGHSMTGNPLGCAVSLESIRLYDSLNIRQKILQIQEWHKEYLQELKNHNFSKEKKILSTRYFGSVAAIDVRLPDHRRKTFNLEIIDFSIRQGALIRPLGNTLYIVPPYIIEKEELGKVYEVILKIIEEKIE